VWEKQEQLQHPKQRRTDEQPIISHHAACINKKIDNHCSYIKSSTIFLHPLPDFYHRQHQASHRTVQRVFSVRRKPTKQNHGGHFVFEPPLHNPLLDFHCRR
jgi:hypothetical protein